MPRGGGALTSGDDPVQDGGPPLVTDAATLLARHADSGYREFLDVPAPVDTALHVLVFFAGERP